jgi:hypothetical protein
MALVNTLLVALLVFAALAKVLLVLDPETLNEEQSAVLPVAATAFLQDSELSGPIFNSYNWGGYLIWFLPDEAVFVDGRTDLYGDEFLRQYLDTARGGDDWRDTFDEYNIQLVMVEAQSGLARQLAGKTDWSLAYEDDMAVIYTLEVGSDDEG